MSDIKKEIIRTETKLGNLNPDDPGFREKAKPLVDKITELQKKLRDDKAEGGIMRLGLKEGSGIELAIAENKKLEERIAANKARTERFNKKMMDMYIRSTPEGVLMDPPPRKNSILSLGEEGTPQDGGAYSLNSDAYSNTIIFDDGTVYYKDTGEYYNDEGGQVPGPSKGAKIKPKEMEAKDGGIMRIGLKEGLTPGQQGPMGPVYTTNKIEDAAKEVIKRLVRIDDAKIPLDDKLSIALRGLDDVTVEGVMEILGGQLSFSAGKEGSDKGIGFNFYKQFADGGRIGLKEGSGMTRRTFLKFLAGAASIPIVGKIFKPLKVGKTVTKVPIIKTDNVPGKPEWFDQLVNKVILEGDDVTKKLATVEREVVHTKKINNTDEVTVYQDLNTDSVRVEYRSPDNMMEEPVDLSYKRTPPDEGSPQASSEFEATEMGYVGRADGPDDYFIDAEEVGGQSIKDLDSDVSALKEYATGEKPTMKEIVQKKKRKDKVKKLNEGDLDAQSDYITARQGDAYDYDDYASGGIARMLGE
jgi:hypothetical protein